MQWSDHGGGIYTAPITTTIAAMPRRTIAALALALLFTAPAHAADYQATVKGTTTVTGDGQPVDQMRFLEYTYSAIRCNAPVMMDVEVAAKPAIQVTIDGNLQNLIRIRLDKDTLVIDSTGSWTTGNQPVVHVALARLRRLDLSGSASAIVDGLTGKDQLLTSLESGELEIRGELNVLDLSINGSGDARLPDLSVGTATVTINGSGQAYVNVSGSLDANISGSGIIRYRGDPEVTEQLSRGGHLVHD
jgi:hypothetical protein